MMTRYAECRSLVKTRLLEEERFIGLLVRNLARRLTRDQIDAQSTRHSRQNLMLNLHFTDVVI